MKRIENMAAQEMQNQGMALSKCSGDTLELIEKYAEDFRCIINDFEEEMGVVPTADDLLWIASEHANRDIQTDCLSDN